MLAVAACERPEPRPPPTRCSSSPPGLLYGTRFDDWTPPDARARMAGQSPRPQERALQVGRTEPSSPPKDRCPHVRVRAASTTDPATGTAYLSFVSVHVEQNPHEFCCHVTGHGPPKVEVLEPHRPPRQHVYLAVDCVHAASTPADDFHCLTGGSIVAGGVMLE